MAESRFTKNFPCQPNAQTSYLEPLQILSSPLRSGKPIHKPKHIKFPEKWNVSYGPLGILKTVEKNKEARPPAGLFHLTEPVSWYIPNIVPNIFRSRTLGLKYRGHYARMGAPSMTVSPSWVGSFPLEPSTSNLVPRT